MKLHSLNARGFAHHFILAIVVVGVAIFGTYYIIRSSAYTSSVDGFIWQNGYATSPNGSTHQVPTAAAISTVAALSPNGKSVAYIENRSGYAKGLTIMPIDVTKALTGPQYKTGTVIEPNIPTDLMGVIDIAWSPGGTKVLVTYRSSSSTTSATNPYKFWIVNTTNKERVYWPSSPNKAGGYALGKVHNVIWASDTELMYTAAADTWHCRIGYNATTTPEKCVNFTNIPTEAGNLLIRDISSDGTKILSISTNTGDAYITKMPSQYFQTSDHIRLTDLGDRKSVV